MRRASTHARLEDMRTRAVPVLVLLVCALVALVGAASRATPTPRPADAPAAEFSATRAASALEPLAGSPRVSGTPKHARARDHLVRELRSLGLDAEILSGVGYVHLPGRALDRTVAARVDSILATRAGGGGQGTVVLATHYDTVVGSPGAADAGIGIATILEVARVVAAEPGARNDLAILITDGEEPGLTGAEAFVRDHANRLRRPIVVVNHEARGGAGRPVTVRTAGEMTAALARTPRPEAESAVAPLFAQAQNNTDFSMFQEAGWRGVDTATLGDSWSYHTPADDLARLDRGSLQLMGDSTLALTRDLLRADLAETDRAPASLPTTLPWGLVGFPVWSVAPLAGLALLLILVAIGWRRARGELTLRGTLAGSALVGFVVVGAALGATACWEIARAVEPGRAAFVGEPGRPLPYLVAELLAAAAVFALVSWFSRRRPGASAVAHGAVLLIASLTLAGAVLLPAVVTWVLIPLLAVAVGLLVTVPLAGGPRAAVLTASLLPGAWAAGAQLSGAFDTGVGAGAPFIGATAGLFLLLVVDPVLGLGPSRRPGADGVEGARPTPIRPSRSMEGESADVVDPAAAKRPARVLSFTVALALTAIALVVPAAATAVAMALDTPVVAPRHEMASVRVDPHTGTATWETTARTSWGVSQNGRTAPADPAAFPAPRLTVVSDRVESAGRHLDLQLTSSRRSPSMTLEVTGARLAGVVVDGVPAPAPAGSTLRVHGLANGRAAVSLTLSDRQDGLSLRLTDHTTDLAHTPGFTDPGAGVLLVRPDVTVSTQLALPNR